MASQIPRIDGRGLSPQQFAAGARKHERLCGDFAFSFSDAATAERRPVIFTGVCMGPCLQVLACLFLYSSHRSSVSAALE
jgi:hypothetical protein